MKRRGGEIGTKKRSGDQSCQTGDECGPEGAVEEREGRSRQQKTFDYERENEGGKEKKKVEEKKGREERKSSSRIRPHAGRGASF